MTSDEALERSALRKAAWRLLPLIGLGYGVAFIDRLNISFAALQMNRDLHFSAAVYGLGAGLFFLSYAALEIPSNLVLMRVGARRWIARIMLTWGVIAVGMMFVRTPLQFYVMRFLLGAAEAGFFPGVIYHLTFWFPAGHRGRAISRFYVAAPLGSLVMGALAGWLLGLNGHLGLAGWQWLFLVEGLPAVLLSLAFLLWLPDMPADAKWLSPDEKRWLSERLAADRALIGAPVRHNILAALLDVRVLALTAVNFMTLGAYYAFNLSAPAVLQANAHLNAGQIGLLVSLGGLTGAAAMILNGWHSDLTRERYLHLAAPLLVQAAAFAAMAFTDSPAIVMAAYVVAITANFAVAGVIWLTPGEILDPRAVGIAVAAINGVGQVASFLMPYAWGVAKDFTGDFRVGLASLIVPYVVAVALVLMMRQAFRRRQLAAA
jgi:ACS family tartrate transporter-like MFS transporter